jgi:drug/metabolite transporter (DMT)-like permease
MRIDRGAIPGLAVLGILDVTANGLFVLASARGYLSIVSVLGSLYPIVTVLAAYAFLGERINTVQRAGVVLALVGVAVVASG